MSARNVGTKTSADASDAQPRSGRRKWAAVAVLALVVTGAGGWWFVLRPAEEAAVTASDHVEVSEEHGEVVPLEAMSLNLADGYLRLGIALQGASEAEDEAEGSAALDAANDLLAGRTKAELADPTAREALRVQLSERVRELYHDEVVEVYFTEFVTQ